MRSVYSLAFSAILFGCATVSAVDFDSEVFPILKTYCAKCHMDGESKGSLTLDRRVIMKQLESGGSIVAGNVKRSDLHWTMTLDPSDDSAMPPKGKRVPPADIGLIAKWIEEGAIIPEKVASAPAAPVVASSGGSEPKTEPDAGATPEPAKPELKPYKGVFKSFDGMQVSGSLVRVDGDRAILVLPDSKEYRYPIEMFAPDTMELVKKFQAGTLVE